MPITRNDIRIGYFTHTPIQISETFLDKMLAYLATQFQLVFYCGQRSSSRNYPCDVRFLGFADNEIEARWGDFLSRVRRRITTSEYRMRVEEQIFVSGFKQLKGLSSEQIDFAFIEYGTTAVVAAPLLAQLEIPYAVSFHGYDASARLGDAAYRKRIKQVINAAEFIVVPSHHLRRRIQLLGQKNVACHILPYSPEYSKLPAPTVPNCHTVVSLGRLTEKKCPQALIMMASLVLQKLPQVQFKFIGGGPLMGETQELIDTMGIGTQVKLLGPLPHHQSLQILASATVVVQHSVTSHTGDQEGFPVSLAEAAALGKTIVSTYHSGITELVEHGKSGYLVQEHDFESMADHVANLLQNPSSRDEMGEYGRRKIKRVTPENKREEEIAQLIRTSSLKHRERDI